MTRKTCTKCGVEKSVDQFNRNAGNRDGFQTKCRACQQAKYQETHHDRGKA